MYIGANRQIKRTGLIQITAVAQHPHATLQQCGGIVGIPNRPGINVALLEGGAGIGRGQVDGLDIGKLQPGFLQ
ncbi:hypothetical protein D3C79_870150 [compost metagenome]